MGVEKPGSRKVMLFKVIASGRTRTSSGGLDPKKKERGRDEHFLIARLWHVVAYVFWHQKA